MGKRKTKKYSVVISECHQKTVDVMAGSTEEAISKVEDMYFNLDVILGSNDFKDVDFKAKELIEKD